jgi:hypothetical protein
VWTDEEGKSREEIVNIVFSYVGKEDLAFHADDVRSFLIQLGNAASFAPCSARARHIS